MLLKQSTAVTLLIGPFVDDADGNTIEDGLTISQADVRLSMNGGNMAQKTEATSCTHDELGYYTCPLDGTDTGTLGILKVMVHESGALPVWHEYQVVPANVWDSLVGGTDYLDSETAAMAANVVTAAAVQDAAIDLATFAAGAIDATVIADAAIDAATFAAGAINAAAVADATIDAATFAAGAIDADAVADDAIDAGAIATGAIDADAIAADTITSSELADGAITAAKIATDAIDDDSVAADVYTAINSGVSDVMTTDTISEMAQGVPPTTPTFEEAVMYLYMALTKQTDVISDLQEYHNEAGTVIWKQDLTKTADLFRKAKGASGP